MSTLASGVVGCVAPGLLPPHASSRPWTAIPNGAGRAPRRCCSRNAARSTTGTLFMACMLCSLLPTSRLLGATPSLPPLRPVAPHRFPRRADRHRHAANAQGGGRRGWCARERGAAGRRARRSAGDHWVAAQVILTDHVRGGGGEGGVRVCPREQGSVSLAAVVRARGRGRSRRFSTCPSWRVLWVRFLSCRVRVFGRQPCLLTRYSTRTLTLYAGRSTTRTTPPGTRS